MSNSLFDLTEGKTPSSISDVIGVIDHSEFKKAAAFNKPYLTSYLTDEAAMAFVLELLFIDPANLPDNTEEYHATIKSAIEKFIDVFSYTSVFAKAFAASQIVQEFCNDYCSDIKNFTEKPHHEVYNRVFEKIFSKMLEVNAAPLMRNVPNYMSLVLQHFYEQAIGSIISKFFNHLNKLGQSLDLNSMFGILARLNNADKLYTAIDFLYSVRNRFEGIISINSEEILADIIINNTYLYPITRIKAVMFLGELLKLMDNQPLVKRINAYGNSLPNSRLKSVIISKFAYKLPDNFIDIVTSANRSDYQTARVIYEYIEKHPNVLLLMYEDKIAQALIRQETSGKPVTNPFVFKLFELRTKTLPFRSEEANSLFRKHAALRGNSDSSSRCSFATPSFMCNMPNIKAPKKPAKKDTFKQDMKEFPEKSKTWITKDMDVSDSEADDWDEEDYI